MKSSFISSFGIQRGGIGRDHAENGLHEAAHGLHGLAEFVVGLGVGLGVARDFAMRTAVIVHAPEVVAAGHGSERAVERQDFESVAREVEVANDFRAQQRDHVGAHRELETRVDLFGDGGASEHVAALEHENFFAGLGEVGGVDEAVMASADHDDIVFGSHELRASSFERANQSLRAKKEKKRA